MKTDRTRWDDLSAAEVRGAMALFSVIERAKRSAQLSIQVGTEDEHHVMNLFRLGLLVASVSTTGQMEFQFYSKDLHA